MEEEQLAVEVLVQVDRELYLQLVRKLLGKLMDFLEIVARLVVQGLLQVSVERDRQLVFLKQLV